MSNSNHCSDIVASQAAYLDAELESSDLREFEQHIHDCEECRSELDDAHKSKQLLQTHLRNTPKAPDLLRKRLALALDKEDQVLKSQRRQRWLAWSFPTAASSIAVAALALFLWSDIQGTSTLPENQKKRGLVQNTESRQQSRSTPIFVSNGQPTARANTNKRPNRLTQNLLSSSGEIRLLGQVPAKPGQHRGTTLVYEILDSMGRHELSVHATKRSHLNNLNSQKRHRANGADLWVQHNHGFTTLTYSNSPLYAYVFSANMSPEALLHLVTNTDVLNIITELPKP